MAEHNVVATSPGEPVTTLASASPEDSPKMDGCRRCLAVVFVPPELILGPQLLSSYRVYTAKMNREPSMVFVWFLTVGHLVLWFSCVECAEGANVFSGWDNITDFDHSGVAPIVFPCVMVVGLVMASVSTYLMYRDRHGGPSSLARDMLAVALLWNQLVLTAVVEHIVSGTEEHGLESTEHGLESTEHGVESTDHSSDAMEHDAVSVILFSLVATIMSVQCLAQQGISFPKFVGFCVCTLVAGGIILGSGGHKGASPHFLWSAIATELALVILYRKRALGIIDNFLKTSMKALSSIHAKYPRCEARLCNVDFDSKLGCGGTGQVFRGTYCGQAIAAKEVFSVALRQELTEEILKESEMWAQAGNHPNVVKYFGFVTLQEHTLMVSELCTASLTDVLASTSRQPAGFDFFYTSEVHRIVVHMCCALQHLHEVIHIRHLDVKPSNIMLQFEGTGRSFVAKLCDFGTAAKAHDPLTTVGTVAFAPPEAFPDTPPPSPVTDERIQGGVQKSTRLAASKSQISVVIDNGLGLQSHGSRGGTFAPASNPKKIGVLRTAGGAIHRLAPPAAPLHGLSKFAHSSFTLQEQSLQVANYSMSVLHNAEPMAVDRKRRPALHVNTDFEGSRTAPCVTWSPTQSNQKLLHLLGDIDKLHHAPRSPSPQKSPDKPGSKNTKQRKRSRSGSHSRSNSMHFLSISNHFRSNANHFRSNSNHSRSNSNHSRSNSSHSRSNSGHSRSNSIHSRSNSTHSLDGELLTLEQDVKEILTAGFAHQASANVHAWDMYSLGIVIWSVVYHQMPWADQNVQEIKAAVVSGQRPSFDSDFVNRCQNWEVLCADRSHHAETIDFFVYLAQACTVQHETSRPTAAEILERIVSHD